MSTSAKWIPICLRVRFWLLSWRSFCVSFVLSLWRSLWSGWCGCDLAFALVRCPRDLVTGALSKWGKFSSPTSIWLWIGYLYLCSVGTVLSLADVDVGQSSCKTFCCLFASLVIKHVGEYSACVVPLSDTGLVSTSLGQTMSEFSWLATWSQGQRAPSTWISEGSRVQGSLISRPILGWTERL